MQPIHEQLPDLPDIRSVEPDLAVPEMTCGRPAAGKRVKQTTAGYERTEVHHALYLPVDWQAGKTYPVIVEYAGNGNYGNAYGDLSTGRVDGSHLGYGISGGEGVIWVCMPCVDTADRKNEITWWGDVDATVAYCTKTVKQVCQVYGGDAACVFMAGFSRGAIACNFLGLHDDDIASLWRGFVAYSHYDGVVTWPYAGSDRVAAASRLQRLGRRPQFICQERSVAETQNYLAESCPGGNFTFQTIHFRNHNDAWALRDIPERRALRRWFRNVLDAPTPASRE